MAIFGLKWKIDQTPVNWKQFLKSPESWTQAFITYLENLSHSETVLKNYPGYKKMKSDTNVSPSHSKWKTHFHAIFCLWNDNPEYFLFWILYHLNGY